MTARRAAGPAAIGHARVAEPVLTKDLIARAGTLLAEGYRLGMVAAHDEGATIRIVYLFLAGSPDRRVELHVTVPASDPRVPSLGALSFCASRFERAMHDLFGVVATNHPLPHRLMRHAHWPSGWYPMLADAGPLPPFADREPFPFVEVEGAGVYEVPVGPVHAGLIEPGHFRFSVVGEASSAQGAPVVPPPQSREAVRGPGRARGDPARRTHLGRHVGGPRPGARARG